MAWLACDYKGQESIFQKKPIRNNFYWVCRLSSLNEYVELPKGSIKKLIGREMSWSDNPIKLK